MKKAYWKTPEVLESEEYYRRFYEDWFFIAPAITSYICTAGFFWSCLRGASVDEALIGLEPAMAAIAMLSLGTSVLTTPCVICVLIRRRFFAPKF